MATIPDEVFGVVVTTAHINAWVAALNTIGVAADEVRTTTGTQTTWSMVDTSRRAQLVYWNGASDLTLRGLAVGEYEGQEFTLRNITTTAGTPRWINCTHNSGSASASKFSNRVTSGGTLIGPGGFATWRWSNLTPWSNQWVLISHSQGAWRTETLSAGNFTGSGGMVWNNISMAQMSYLIENNKLTLAFDVSGDLTTAAGAELQISANQYGGYTSLLGVTDDFMYNDAGTGNQNGYCSVAGSGGNVLKLAKFSNANWTLGTGGTGNRSFGTVFFDIQ